MDANDDPVREGVYELLNESTGKTFFARWIVKEGFYYFYVGWGRGDHDIEAAAAETEHGIVQKRWPWRGLSENPDASRWPYNSKMQNVAKGGR